MVTHVQTFAEYIIYIYFWFQQRRHNVCTRCLQSLLTNRYNEWIMAHFTSLYVSNKIAVRRVLFLTFNIQAEYTVR